MIISLIVVVLTFVGYVPYVKDIILKKTTPHAFTWFVFTLAGFIGYFLQVFGGAGVGAWGLLTACVFCLVIFILSLWHGERDIKKIDIVFLILSIASLFLWLVVKQPVWSVILAVIVEVLGIVPTIRKSWNKPYSETLSNYEVASFRHGLSIFALQKFNILTVLYPVSWTLVNIIFSTILIVRRKTFKRSNTSGSNIVH